MSTLAILISPRKSPQIAKMGSPKMNVPEIPGPSVSLEFLQKPWISRNFLAHPDFGFWGPHFQRFGGKWSWYVGQRWYTYVKNSERHRFWIRYTYLVFFAIIDLVKDMNTRTWAILLETDFEFNTNTYTSKKVAGNSKCIYSRAHGKRGEKRRKRGGRTGSEVPPVLLNMSWPALIVSWRGPLPKGNGTNRTGGSITLEHVWGRNVLYFPGFHRVLQGAAQRGGQFYFIFVALQSLFHAAKWAFSALKLAPPWGQPPEAPLEGFGDLQPCEIWKFRISSESVFCHALR